MSDTSANAKAFRTAYEAMAQPEGHYMVLGHATLALGVLYGTQTLWSAAAVAHLWAKAYPDSPLPPPIAALLAGEG